MMDTRPRGSRLPRYRLAWAWKDSGIHGSSPWLDDRRTVEQWLSTLGPRYADRMDHWIEEDAERGDDASA